MMVLAVLLAWAGGRIYEDWLVAAHRVRQVAIRSGPTTRPEDDSPFGLNDSLGGSGLVPFDGDPAGVSPPPGCRRLYGFQRRSDLDVERQVRYEVAGSADAAAGHYAGQLARLGYRVLEDRAGPNGRRTLVFGKLDAWVTVSLLNDPKHAKMVSIVVVAVTPAAQAPAPPNKR